ncbi:hypothetical protein FAGKG844_350066 [Frankia sp. AgKG'84/4]
MTPVLEGLDPQIRPATIAATTAQDLTNLIDDSNIKNGTGSSATQNNSAIATAVRSFGRNWPP